MRRAWRMRETSAREIRVRTDRQRIGRDFAADAIELVEEVRRPRLHAVRLDAPPQRAHARLTLRAAHRQRPRDRVGDRVDVVRIDHQRLAELVGRARELAQHQHAVVVEPRRDELLRDEVHAVAQRRHQHHVGGAIEGGQLLGGNAAVHVVHRHVGDVPAAPLMRPTSSFTSRP